MSGTWERHDGVTVAECPQCAFCFDADHTHADGGLSCPICAEADAIDRLKAALGIEGLAGDLSDLVSFVEACMEETCILSYAEVGLAIDAVAGLVQPREPNEYRPLLHKLQDSYRKTRRLTDTRVTR